VVGGYIGFACMLSLVPESIVFVLFHSLLLLSPSGWTSAVPATDRHCAYIPSVLARIF
jgi:hypothetical protein